MPFNYNGAKKIHYASHVTHDRPIPLFAHFVMNVEYGVLFLYILSRVAH